MGILEGFLETVVRHLVFRRRNGTLSLGTTIIFAGKTLQRRPDSSSPVATEKDA